MAKIKYGLSNCYYSVVTENVTTSGISYSYATPVAIPGAVSLSLDIEGSDSPFYADNVVYYKTVANNGYSGDLEIALIPDSFRTAVLNETNMQNGILAEYSNKYPKAFAFGFQIEGDTENTRYWFYNCMASRPAVNGSTTEDTIEPQTDTLTISLMPRTKDSLVRIKSSASTPSGTYNSWFSAVIEPSAATT